MQKKIVLHVQYCLLHEWWEYNQETASTHCVVAVKYYGENCDNILQLFEID